MLADLPSELPSAPTLSVEQRRNQAANLVMIGLANSSLNSSADLAISLYLMYVPSMLLRSASRTCPTRTTAEQGVARSAAQDSPIAIARSGQCGDRAGRTRTAGCTPSRSRHARTPRTMRGSRSCARTARATCRLSSSSSSALRHRQRSSLRLLLICCQLLSCSRSRSAAAARKSPATPSCPARKSLCTDRDRCNIR